MVWPRYALSTVTPCRCKALDTPKRSQTFDFDSMCDMNFKISRHFRFVVVSDSSQDSCEYLLVISPNEARPAIWFVDESIAKIMLPSGSNDKMNSSSMLSSLIGYALLMPSSLKKCCRKNRSTLSCSDSSATRKNISQLIFFDNFNQPTKQCHEWET